MAKFQPGQSGNPKGRPKRTETLTRLREQLSERAPAIIERMIQAALDGDSTAAKLILERCLPVLKAEGRPLPEKVQLDPDGILEAVARGIVTLEQARDLMALLGERAKIAEAFETAERLERIERLLGSAR